MHRRLLRDDSFGVAEALNEMAFKTGLIARGKHYVMFGSTNGDSPSLAAQERDVAQRKILSPWIFFTPTELEFKDWQTTYKMEVSFRKCHKVFCNKNNCMSFFWKYRVWNGVHPAS